MRVGISGYFLMRNLKVIIKLSLYDKRVTCGVIHQLMDCIYQGEQLENMNLYQWIRQCKCLPMPKSHKNKKKQCSESEEESDNNDSDNDSIIDEKKTCLNNAKERTCFLK